MTMAGAVVLTPLRGFPEVAPGADLGALVRESAQKSGVALTNGVLCVCQKIISKAEGALVDLRTLEPRPEAIRIAEEDGKDPRHIELILRESARIVRRAKYVLISETLHGFVCANAGVDLSNAPADGHAVLLPVDPDASARRLRGELLALGAEEPLGIVVSDTFGRPWREGLVDVAIGCAGFRPLDDWRGRADLRGRELTVTVNATADQLAAAAGLLMAKDAGIPAVFCEGVTLSGDGSAQELVRKSAIDLFR
jgi:coenzyme F420-0:L-glutamate ligase/coenzyme F420-1:gamma-L-glutamate ligase